MDAHPTLTLSVYILLSVAAALVILYWVAYTRRLRTRSRAGTQEGIAAATQDRERTGHTGGLEN